MKSAFNRAYAQRRNLFGNEVFAGLSQIVQELANLETPEALDVGCGQGKDSLFLASQGFTVTALDCSDVAIGQLSSEAEQLQVRIKCVCADISSFSLKEDSFDLVLVRTMLHHLAGQDCVAVLRRLQQAVRPNGFFAATAFTIDDAAASGFQGATEFGPTIRHFFARGELLSFFGDWDLALYQERTTLDESHGVPHNHATAKIIARRKL